jgi:secondary thiamine-phosphate synthase enzyme
MAVYSGSFTVRSEARPTFDDVTGSVEDAVARSGIRNGIVLVYSQHTTCSVMLQEDSHDESFFGTRALFSDLVAALEKIVPTCRREGDYAHPGPKHIAVARGNGEEAWWSLNTDAHLRSVIMGRSETIPLTDGALALGAFGRIWFGDFDQVRARERTVRVQVVGD